MATAGLPREEANPNEKLVRVFDTEQESEALVVRGLLESEGIECEVASLDAAQTILPGVGGTVILVREEDAERARQVIASSKQTDDTTAEMAAIIENPEPQG